MVTKYQKEQEQIKIKRIVKGLLGFAFLILLFYALLLTYVLLV